MTETEFLTLYVYAPTEKGWQEYEANRETYNEVQFAIPIQGGV